MNLSKLALENSRLTIIGILIVIALGTSQFITYPRAEDPTVTIRQVEISASFPGMSPDRVEELITKPIESAMREIAEIDEINSISKTGSSQVKLDIHDRFTTLEPIFQDIRNKADDLKRELPDGTIGPSVSDDVGLTAVATIALWADGFSLGEMRDVAREIRDQVYTLTGVKKIELIGIQDERIYLELDPSEYAQLELSPRDVFGALANQNIVEPGGQIVSDGRTLIIEPSGNLSSVDEIRNTVFRIPETDRVLTLGDVVSVRRSLVDPPQFPAYFNNRPTIVISVSTVEGTNNVEFGKRLTALITDIQSELPIGYVLEYATFQPELIAAAVGSAVSNVYQTLAIVLVVVMLFLGLRTGLIVGSFVPLTMLLGIIVMRAFDVELQRMSIAATIIALGMLVDNGIVVAEDIRARLEQGVGRSDAAIQAGRTLAIPLLTSSLTTIFAFLPMLLIDGATGEFVRSLAQVVAILLLASWLLSMTVTPAMCAWFMRVSPQAADQKGPSYDGFIYRLYRKVLFAFLRWRLASIGSLIGLLVIAVLALGTIRTEFFPLGDRNQLLVYLDFEAGTDVRETERQLRKLTSWLSDKSANPEITSNIAYVGFGGPRFFLALSPVDPDPHHAFVLVNTSSAADVSTLIGRINSFADQNMPTGLVDAKKMWFGSSEPGLIQIRLVGVNQDALTQAAGKLVNALHEIEGTVGIEQDWENKVLSLVADVDQVRARRAGVTSSDVASALNTTFAGLAISDYREGDRIIPIVVRGNDDLRFSLSSLGQVQVYSSSSDSFVSLGQVATINAEWRHSRIKRRNQVRTVTVEARNPNLPAPKLLELIQPALNALDLPAGHKLEIGGEIEDQAEANQNLFGLLPLALAGIIVLLVGQFNSFRKGTIIIATIPLILIGGVLGLIVMNAPFGFMVILGLFSLAGILINNGIVLIDRIQIEERAGRDALDAIVTACLARLRPILMTTLTTVLGLVPLILFGGALFYGMASVIAIGLIVATLFTLGFVPVLYTLFFRINTDGVADAVSQAPRPTG